MEHNNTDIKKLWEQYQNKNYNTDTKTVVAILVWDIPIMKQRNCGRYLRMEHNNTIQRNCCINNDKMKIEQQSQKGT